MRASAQPLLKTQEAKAAARGGACGAPAAARLGATFRDAIHDSIAASRACAGQHKPVPRKDVRPLVIGVACWNHVGVHRVLMVFRKPLSVFMRRDDGRRRLPHLFDQRASGAEHGVRGLGCLQQCFCFTKLVDGIFLKFRVCSALPLPPSCTRRTQINARRAPVQWQCYQRDVPQALQPAQILCSMERATSRTRAAPKAPARCHRRAY